MRPDNGPGGEALLAIATLVSLQIAQGRGAEELELIAAFFEVLGDNLALIALRRPTREGTAGARADREQGAAAI